MILVYTAVADLDLQIRLGGGGGGVIQTLMCQTKFFSQFRLKIRGGGGGVWAPRALPQNLPLHCRLFWFGA